MVDINVLIVIYNQPLEYSRTIRTLKAPETALIYVVDNSTMDYGNRAFAEAHGYIYIGMGSNMGLSKAYNRAISQMDMEDEVLCLFDDDTMMDSRYFEKLSVAMDAHPDIDVFAPVVKDRKGMLSPCVMSSVACRRVSSVDELPERGVSAINSGLAVRMRVFEYYRYDEEQFLDYIDHAFFRDITGHELSRMYIMKDVELRQEFSGSTKQSRQVALQRYRSFKKDITVFCRKYDISPFSRMLLLIRRRLRLLLG